MNVKQLLYSAVTLVYLVVPSFTHAEGCHVMPSFIHANDIVGPVIEERRENAADANGYYEQFKTGLKTAAAGLQTAAVLGICAYVGRAYYRSIKASLARLESAVGRVEETQGKHTGMLAGLRSRLNRVLNTQAAHTQDLANIQNGQKTLLGRLESHANLTKEQLEQIHAHNRTVEKTLNGIHQEMGGMNSTIGRLDTNLNGMRQAMGKQIDEIGKVGTENTKTLNEILKEVMAHRTETQEGTNALGKGLHTIYSAVQKRLQNVG